MRVLLGTLILFITICRPAVSWLSGLSSDGYRKPFRLKYSDQSVKLRIGLHVMSGLRTHGRWEIAVVEALDTVGILYRRVLISDDTNHFEEILCFSTYASNIHLVIFHPMLCNLPVFTFVISLC